jgi:hypothetical protein
MKTLLIVVGIVVLIWLGFLTVNRNSVQLHLNRHDEKMYEHDRQFETLDDRYQMKDGFISEENPIDKTEDKLDKAEDKFDKKIEMPYENEETNENDNLLKDDNAVPPANDKDEIDLKPNPSIDNELDKGNKKDKNKNPRASLDLENESMVAFGYVTDHMYRGQSVEAFQLDHEQDEAIIAFRVR